MTQHPDKLFRKGLEHYHKPAPSTAWERIESGLERKRNRSPWMKIAAGLILLIATSAVIIQLNPTDAIADTASKESAPVGSPQSAVGSRDSVVSRETSDVSREVVVNRESVDVSRQAVVNRESSGVRREVVVNRESSGVRREVVINRESSDVRRETLSIGQPSVHSQQSTVSSPQSAVSSLQSTASSVQSAVGSGQFSLDSPTDNVLDTKGTSITYSAEEVNAKFLKKESVPEATPEKKNTSGLQKVIDLAMDLKNEGNVIGELRDKKNELLSFNMPSSKRETNK